VARSAPTSIAAIAPAGSGHLSRPLGLHGARNVSERFSPTHSFPLPAQKIPTVCNDNTVLGLLFAGWDDPVDESGGTA
jgi:hypothetical protein